MGLWGYVLAAHVITWTVVVAYLINMKRRSRQIDRQLAALRQRRSQRRSQS